MPTVTSLKRLLQVQIAPGDDEEFLRLLQEAEIRLCAYGRWRWTRTKIPLTHASGIVTLEPAYAAILGAQVDGAARDIRGEEFEFAPEGAGDIEVNGMNDVMLIDQGLNEDGLRHYKIVGRLNADTTVTALVHKAPVTLYDPDIADSSVPDDAVDTTLCPDIAALKQVMLAIIYEEANDPERSSKYFAIALRGLDDREKMTRGGARQMFNIRPNGPGIGRVRSFR